MNPSKSDLSLMPAVVVVNDDITQQSILCGLLKKASLNAIPYKNAETALEGMCQSPPPALIITDLYMPGIDGWRFCRLLRSPDFAQFNHVPILVMSATFSGDEPSQITSDLGANAFMPMPVDGQRFIAQVQALIKGEKPQNISRALIVEDSKLQSSRLLRAFEAHGYQVEAAFSYQEALGLIQRMPFNVAVLDYHLPDRLGDALLKDLQLASPDCIAIMITADLNPELALTWMKAGAAAYLLKPFEPEYLIAQCERARRERALLRIQDLLEVRTSQLRESEAKYRSLVQYSSDPIFSINPDETYRFVNEAFARRYGFTPEQVIGMTPYDLYTHAEAEKRLTMIREVLHTGRKGEIEVKAITHTGENRTYLTIADPIQDEQGNVLYVTCISKDITERIQVENALRESEEKFSKVFRFAPVWIAITDMQDAIHLDVNEQVLLETGFSRDQVIGHTAVEIGLSDPGDRQRLLQEFNDQGRITGLEMVFHARDGRSLQGWVCGEQIIISGRACLLTITVDITLLKNVEESLRETGEKYRQLFDAESDAIYLVDSESGRILEANTAASKLFGYSSEEMVAMHFLDFSAEPEKTLQSTLDQEVFIPLRWYKKKDGTVFPVEISAGHLSLQGRQVHIAAIRDISSRLLQEKEIREKEKDYRIIFDSVPMMVWFMDVNGKIIRANKTAAEITGLPVDKLIGLTHLDLYDEKTAGLFLEDNQEVIRTGKSKLGIVETYTGQNGTTRWAETSKIPYLDDDGQVLGVLIIVNDITEKKQAEEHLKLLKYTIDVSPDGAYWMDPNGKFLYANEAGCQALGYRLDELLDMHIFNVNLQANPEVWDRIWRTIKDKKVFTAESTHRRKDGSIFPVEITSTYVEFGDHEYCNGFARDITERKKTDQALHESLAQFRAVVQTASDAIITMNTRGIVTSWNPAAETIFGFTEKEAVGMSVYTIVPEPYRSRMAFRNQQANESNRWNIVGETVEFAGMNKDGREFPVEMSLAEWETQAGKFFTGIIRDISERKQAEDTLRASETSLIFSQRVAHVGHWTWNTVTNNVIWSDEMFRIFGLDPATFDGDLTRIISEAIHPDDREKVNQSNNAVLTEQRPEPMQYRVIWPDQSVHTVWAEAGEKIFNANGEIIQLQGIVQDITERVHAEEEIRKLNASLEQRVQARTAEIQAVNKELEAFAYSVSHDLRAPLRGLDGFSGALLDEYHDKLDEQGRHYLLRIQEASRRMGQLIEDLLNLSRISRANMTLNRVDLSSLARKIASDLQDEAPDRQLQFKIQSDLCVQADANLMKIVLENLMQNAYKFTSKREKTFIEFGLIEQKGECIYYIRDNGVGFNIAYADKLFTPFQRLHGMSEYPGTGIGLSIVHRIIARHGGRIWPEAAIDQGTTFYFTLGSPQ